jgi:hypothetical protein
MVTFDRWPHLYAYGSPRERSAHDRLDFKVYSRIWATFLKDVATSYGSEIVMHRHMAHLAEVRKRLSEVVLNLREQQCLLPELDCPQIHKALLMLLSNGLRMYYWLKAQERGLRENLR